MDIQEDTITYVALGTSILSVLLDLVAYNFKIAYSLRAERSKLSEESIRVDFSYSQLL